MNDTFARYPGYRSDFFAKLTTNHDKRMEQECYRNIKNKVASLYHNISPRGCSQNNRIQFEDLDKAKQDIIIKETQLKKYTETEFSKLNNPLLTQLDHSAKKEINTKESYVVKNSKKFIKNRKNKSEGTRSIGEVLNQIDFFKPQITPKKKEIISHAYFRKTTAFRVVNYLEDLTKCLKTSTDEDNTRKMMSNLSQSRKMNTELKKDLKDIRAQMLETTGKIIKMSGYKLWRQNNINLMSATDKIISSLPMIKK
jgi:hypothetical protein